jgi:hypothetical protein
VSATVSTVKKSHARTPAAWERRNSAQVGPPRLGRVPSHCTGGCCARRWPTPSSRAWRTRHRSAGNPSEGSPVPAARPVPRGQDRGPNAGLTRVRPSTSHELLMPAQQRGRRHQERRPALPRQQPGQGGQDQAIGGGVPRAGNLAVQHSELVAQYGDLDVLVVVLGTQVDQPKDASYEEEQEGRGHASYPGSCTSWLLRADFLYLHPSGGRPGAYWAPGGGSAAAGGRPGDIRNARCPPRSRSCVRSIALVRGQEGKAWPHPATGVWLEGTDPHRTGGRSPCRARPHQPRNRPSAVRLAAYRGNTPCPRVS